MLKNRTVKWNESQASFSFCLAEAGSGQDYVTSENQLLYYPSITYAIIGSSVIFVLVVAFLALVLHHQRKRNNLMTLPVHRLQHPVLLSRLVVLDHPHHCSVTYNVNNGIQYMSNQTYHRPVDLDSPPSYSEAVLDQRYVQQLFLFSPKFHTGCSCVRLCFFFLFMLIMLLMAVLCCYSVKFTCFYYHWRHKGKLKSWS